MVISLTSAPAPSLSLHLPAPSLPFSAPPITAFMGIPPAIVGSVGSRRTASAHSTLPQHNGNSPSRPAHHRGPSNAFPAAPSRDTSSSHSTTTQMRTASGIFSTNVSLAVAVYPLVVCLISCSLCISPSHLFQEPGDHEIPGHPTFRLAVRNDQLLDYVDRLMKHGLLLTLSVPRQGLASPTNFTELIVAALLSKNLLLPPAPHPLTPAESSQLHKQPWTLLHPSRRNLLYKFSAHPTINANNFGIQEFQQLAKKAPNPQPHEGSPKPLIFICIPLHSAARHF